MHRIIGLTTRRLQCRSSDFGGRDTLKRITVAIVGADGSGKSTVADRLLAQPHLRLKYMYMGASIDQSNFSLPTSRWLMNLKRRRLAPLLGESGQLPPARLMSDEMNAGAPRGRVVKALGMINRVAEEWYRQFVVWGYRIRGYSVICDRHFLYEHFPNVSTQDPEEQLLSVRIHAFLLRHFYPHPDLTLFLDAPAEVLHARKPEWTLDHLEHQRTGITEQGRSGRNFVRIDATQPADAVMAEVSHHITEYCENGRA